MNEEKLLFKIKGLGLDIINFSEDLSAEEANKYIDLEIAAKNEVKVYFEKYTKDIKRIHEDKQYNIYLVDIDTCVSLGYPGHLEVSVYYLVDNEDLPCRIEDFIRDYVKFQMKFVIPKMNGDYFDIEPVD